jgi:succinate dehydrogenase/fumarate reductase flavoprotein subunit
MTSLSARMRAPTQKIQTIETDIVIIGGGVAGCLAALGAAEIGAKVVICEKGGIIERSGSVAAGVDHYIAILEEGPEWDTPEYLLRHIPAVTEGVTDIEAAGRLVHGLKPMVRYLENLGVDFHDPENNDIPYYRHRAFGLPGKYHINFDGSDFKRAIGHAVRKTRARVLERVMVTEILREDGQPKGAVAFHIRHGTVYFISARAVVVATGDANRLGRNASGLPFDSWHMPYNTGDGHAMALRVGARLGNMEFTDCTVTPKGYSTQGLNAFMGGGAYLINALGERFMVKYSPDGERGRRSDIVNGVVSETLAGRSPIYCDCTHLPQEDIRRLENTLGVDRPALPIFFAQKKIDLAREPFEVTVGEIATVRAGALFRGAGVHINADCASNIPGLFAAGDCTTMGAAIAGAAVMGHVAGVNAGRYALSQPKSRPLAVADQERIRETLYRPLQQEQGLKFHQFEDQVRTIVTGLIGYRRDEQRLREALRQLHGLREREAEMIAEDYHGVMRVNEARSIRAVAEAIAASAIERRESRGGGSHFRLDYPKKDDGHGLRIIEVEQLGDELQVSSHPTGIPSSVLPEAPAKKEEW